MTEKTFNIKEISSHTSFVIGINEELKIAKPKKIKQKRKLFVCSFLFIIYLGYSSI